LGNNDYMKPGLKLYLFSGWLAGVNGLIIGNIFDVIRTIQLTSKEKLNVL
jgi:hypothetical protein